MFPAYIQPPLEFKLVDSQGIPCRAKFWPSKKHCETYLLFIPGTQLPDKKRLRIGNPGVISYYDEFLTSLHDDSPNTTILGVSLAGHEEYEVNPPLSLQQEIHSKLRIVDTIFQSSPFTSLAGDKPRFIVMGHSVGAYISFEILKQRPQQVDNLFLLFPTLSALSEGSTFGRFASVVTQVPYASVIAALITFIFRLIFPIPLLALWLRLGHSLTGTSLSVTLAKLFNPASVRSFSYLARHEFRDIRELDVDSLTKYAKRITAYYAVQDGWVPNTERERIMGIVNGNGGDAFICNEGFPHAFSLSTTPFVCCAIVDLR